MFETMQLYVASVGLWDLVITHDFEAINLVLLREYPVK